MAREEEIEYDSNSAPGTPRNLAPGTPRNLAPGSPNSSEKKIKTGLKKLISFTKNKNDKNDLDKSERGIVKDEGGGSPSPSKRFNLFKRSPRSIKVDEDASFTNPTKKDEPKPENNEKPQNLPEQNKESLQEKHRPSNEALEETKPSDHNRPAETLGDVLKPHERAEESQNQPHKQTQATIDDKGQSKEHQELKDVANAVEEKVVVKHDHEQHHHKQNEDLKCDTKDEKPVAASEAVEEHSRDLGSPPPPPPLQEDAVGCESLAKGLQKVCLPWTINKEDH